MLNRKQNESVCIWLSRQHLLALLADPANEFLITVKVTKIAPTSVKLGFTSPQEVVILREEVSQRQQADRINSLQTNTTA